MWNLNSRSSTLIAASLLLLPGCASPSSDQSFDIDGQDAGANRNLREEWVYRSAEVDIDLSLETAETGSDCSTWGNLRVNTVTAAPVTYASDRLACSQLRLSSGGDIVVYELTTGHDWSTEPIDIDEDHDRIELGPWAPDADPTHTYRFTLGTRRCADGCDCAELNRRFGAEEILLDLGNCR